MKIQSIQTAYTSPSRSIRKPSYPYRPSLQGSALRENSKANGTIRYGATRLPRWVFLLGVLLAACARPSTPPPAAPSTPAAQTTVAPASTPRPTPQTIGERIADHAIRVEEAMTGQGMGGTAINKTLHAIYGINLNGNTNDMVQQLRKHPDKFHIEENVPGAEIVKRAAAGNLPVGSIVYLPPSNGEEYGNMVVYVGHGMFVGDFQQSQGKLIGVENAGTVFTPREDYRPGQGNP